MLQSSYSSGFGLVSFHFVDGQQLVLIIFVLFLYEYFFFCFQQTLYRNCLRALFIKSICMFSFRLNLFSFFVCFCVVVGWLKVWSVLGRCDENGFLLLSFPAHSTGFFLYLQSVQFDLLHSQFRKGFACFFLLVCFWEMNTSVCFFVCLCLSNEPF